MTPWRIGRGWPDAAIQRYLAALADRPVTAPTPADLLASPAAWTVERQDAIVGREPPGPPLPDGPFVRACRAVRAYRFADPRITRGHFEPPELSSGSDLLVEAFAPPISMLVGLRVGALLDEADDAHTIRGIRLDTLAGHVLDGSEWVIVQKDHRTGTIGLRLDVQWRPSRLLNWWMRLGLRLLGRQTQRRWRRQAVRRLQALVVQRSTST